MFNKMDRDDSRNLLLHLQAAHDVVFSHLHELAVGSVERRSLEESLEENILPSMPMIDDIRKRFKASMLMKAISKMKAISAKPRAAKSTKQASTLTVATKAMKATKAKAMKAMKSMTKAKKPKARKAKKSSKSEPEPEP